ncbi:AraC family transcriptional regulator [Myxococcus stipitatus DSM 14675]|uniref:AraC family transcriptional regulator n=1 Tax=Myxococcus stipitatus (strain DSM 14675 / JCM 12634 / Mx s8) TaxID=1278073 RepID=L7UBY0_MYXSD|nr:helix-turn-helix transcriptional regulator [Myxococcus stipitatus]AGC43944.1 AraC family transcriptional regulator [Myxococcus stipitatus DSM 14675]
METPDVMTKSASKDSLRRSGIGATPRGASTPTARSRTPPSEDDRLRMEDQGVMTSSALTAVLKAAVAREHPGIVTEGRDKLSILQDVMDAHGWRPVLELGRALRVLSAHPVLRALSAGQTPRQTVERWCTLERFMHSRHRTRLIEDDPAEARMTLRHVAIDGGRIRVVNDLFIWGVLVAILETAGFTGLTVSLASTSGAFVIHGGKSRVGSRTLPPVTDVATFTWSPTRRTPPPLQPPSAEGATDQVRDRLQSLMGEDLLHPWTLEESARRLTLSRRSLQRALHEEGTTFSETLQRSRVDAAHGLLADASLSLTDVAFCTGFSDQAHFSRTFRKYNDVPPSALRDLVRSKAAPR